MATVPFDLNLRHLRALLAIREHGSITAAADVVSLSQPALTQGLAKLERQFGYTFFERRSGGMVPTPMGEIVIERARAALDHLSQAAKGLSGVFHYPERLMTMTQLRAFLALAEAGSFAAAAHGSTLSQTAVHRAVGDLEQMIGGKLVERRGRAVWLNPAGKRLARGTRLAVAEIGAALAIFFNSGQVCLAASRLYVERSVFDKVVDGYFVEPTIFANPGADASIVREEIFGPVLVAMPFDDVDDVIRQANDTRYGLAANIWTRDLSRAHLTARQLQAGTVWINTHGMNDPSAPFGGMKESGWGREVGEEGVLHYTETKTVTALLECVSNALTSREWCS